ncbi:MAG TPA: hypothetical protein VIO61_07660 [Anaerolineaceae bacterium]
MSSSKPPAWKKRWRVQIQGTALILLTLAPFLMYSSLQNQVPVGMWIGFILIALGMTITFWIS